MDDSAVHRDVPAVDRQKVSRLLQYLQKVTGLRSTPARTTDAYEDLLWLSDVPRDPSCFTRAWGPDADRGPEIWLEVEQRAEPALPAIPASCEGWVNLSRIRNTKEIPTLRQEITRQVPNPAHDAEPGGEPEELSASLHLVEHPEVTAAWSRYVEAAWLPWAEQHDEWERRHNVYSKLFAIHQAELRLGERFELVLGLGLLTWQTSTDQRVRRHVIVADAALNFEPKRGRFTVGPAEEGAKVRPELDMLDASDQPTSAERIAVEGLAAAADDPWDSDTIGAVLNSLAHSLGPQGEYSDAIDAKDVQTSPRPMVTLAPAIVLRKRSSKGLLETLRRIQQRVESGDVVPPGFADLAEARAQPGCEHEDLEATNPSAAPDDEVYFPKPSNEAQRQIVTKLRASNGALVQGPPGTGKSHTIANLICHLLATGHRLLVTAKTPRALRVLENLLPEEMRPLCVNLLGSGTDERGALERSVGGILQRSSQWDAQRAERERQALDDRLRDLRAEQSEIDQRLRAIREAETHSASVADGAYQGTAARIAIAIERDRRRYGWFADTAPLHQPCPVSSDQCLRLLAAARELTPAVREELSHTLPDHVPSVEEFGRLVKAEQSGAAEQEAAQVGTDAGLAAILEHGGTTAIQGLFDACLALHATLSRLPIPSQPWLVGALREIAAGAAAPCRELLRATQVAISTVEPIAIMADETTLQLPAQPTPRVIRDDARTLMEHLRRGGKLGWSVIRPSVVRERIYLLKVVTVNGHACSTAERLGTVADVLNARVVCEDAWRAWAGRHAKPDGTYRLQVAELKALRDALLGAIEIEPLVNECNVALKPWRGEFAPTWSDSEALQRIAGACRLALARTRMRLVSSQIRDLEESVRNAAAYPSAHPATAELLSAIQSRDVTEFTRCVATIERLRDRRREAESADEQCQRLRRELPSLIECLGTSAADSGWDERLHDIEGAWRWSQARFWLEQYIRKEDAPALAVQARRVAAQINSTLAQLASVRAWSCCFDRMTDEHRAHMAAWQQAMRKLGKGTGKFAWSHRRDAQTHLDACRDAVPAWVMPLHRVWDTIDPKPGMFDVVIVDEASQCGVEALPLFYLGKKLLIVGDDKQISPESVGVDRGNVLQFAEELLGDFAHASSFDLESSLFDQGRIRYGRSQITLREHFRCMPEIIRFSNELCYSGTPLIPLRQYGPDRLPPLEHVFVKGGFRDGRGSSVTNRPEADAVVDRVVAMCRDTRYSGRTIGVISMQGEAQAKLIERLLLNEIGADEVQRRRLVCGDAYSFQGDERDIILLSLVAAPNARLGALSKAADERRFNVAASRARDMMILFHSVERSDLSPLDLRRRLLEFFEDGVPTSIVGTSREELERRAAQDNRSVVGAPVPFESWFEVDVALAVLRRGYTVLPQFECAGKRIDFVVQGGMAKLAVECDGDHWHGPDRYEEDMQRQRQLERCGWEFFRVRESAFRADREAALDKLWSMLDERGIRPYAWPHPPGTESERAERDPAAPDTEDADVTDDVERDDEEVLQAPDAEEAALIVGRRADDISSAEIEAAIVRALARCANRTCTVKSITSRVLKECGIRTRGMPWAAFEHRTLRCVAQLERSGRIQGYKAKNPRLRLLPVR